MIIIKIVLAIIAFYRGWYLWSLLFLALPFIFFYGIASVFGETSGDSTVITTYYQLIIAGNILSLFSIVALIFMALTPRFKK